MEKYRGIIPEYSHKGFSLFELLVVLVIISLMSAFVVPQLAGPLMKMNARTSARKVAAALRYARSRAVAEKIPYIAVLDWENHRVSVSDYPSLIGEQPADAGDENQALGENISKTYDLPQGVRLLKGEGLAEGPEPSSSCIVFYSSGGSSGGDVVIADEKERIYLLYVDYLTGAVELHE